LSAMSIGDAARKTGVPAWKIRAWDTKGLIRPKRADNGFRVFGESDLDQIRKLAAQTPSGNRLQHFASRVLVEEASEQPVASTATGAGLGHAWAHLMHALRNSRDDQTVIEAGLDAVLMVCNAGIGAILTADNVRQEFVPLATRGLSEAYLRATVNWQLHEGLAGRSFTMREPVTANDLTHHHGASRVSIWRQLLRGYLCVPMLRGGRCLGVIQVFSSEARDFTADEITDVEQLASLLALVIDAQLTARQLEVLHSQRSDLTRRWTTQWSIATQAERERVASLIDVAIGSTEAEEIGIDQVVVLLRKVAERVRASDRALVDSAALLRDQIRSHLTSAQWQATKVEFRGWPELLPLEFATRHALAIGQVIARASAQASGNVDVRASRNGAELVVELLFPADSDWAVDIALDRDFAARSVLDSLGADYRSRTQEKWRILRISVVPPSATPAFGGLSTREREVLQVLGSSLSNSQLAKDLGISVKTLQNHLTSIYRKLEVANRVEAVNMLNAHGVSETVV
jgi:DNA-binding CsgD family transcriptional regulator/DNA-binding transcriptional MerR regulator